LPVSSRPKNIDHIFNDHDSQDMTKDQFKPHGFVVINLTSKKDAGKYRSGFDDLFIAE